MHPLRWIVLALALFQGGWLAFDGGRALVVGDYVTPATGPRAGQLGPWSRVVSAFGFDPRGAFIKSLHVALGLAWLVASIIFAIRPSSGWFMVLGCAVASLWYLPAGTFVGIVVIALLMAPQTRS